MSEPIIDIRAALKDRLSGADQDLALLLIATTRLGRILRWDVQQTARLAGLEASDHAVLLTLWLAGPDHPLSPTELSQVIIQTTSGMAKTVRRLERAALVERVPDPADRRRQQIRLTPAGSELVEPHIQEMLDRWKVRLDAYSPSEQARLGKTFWSFVTQAEEAFLGRATVGSSQPSDRRSAPPPPTRRGRPRGGASD